MAQIPSFRRILRERFPTDLEWMDALLSPLNKFMEDVTLALQKRLTIADNLDGEVKTIEVNGTYPVKLAWGRTQKPTIGYLGGLELSDGTTVTLSNAITPLWEYNQAGEVQINDVVGLDDSSTKKYKVKMVFLVG
jgi:hypothetical protein